MIYKKAFHPRGDPLLVRVKKLDPTQSIQEMEESHCIERVNVFDSMLGTKHTITTLEGRNLAISIKGTQSGTVLSISEQGLPTRGGRRGNIYLTIQADIPSVSKTEWVETLTRIKMKLIKAPDEFLEKKVKDFDSNTMDAEKFPSEMFDIMKKYEGVGLAANPSRIGCPNFYYG